jgi:hypothetical protein
MVGRQNSATRATQHGLRVACIGGGRWALDKFPRNARRLGDSKMGRTVTRVLPVRGHSGLAGAVQSESCHCTARNSERGTSGFLQIYDSDIVLLDGSRIIVAVTSQAHSLALAGRGRTGPALAASLIMMIMGSGRWHCQCQAWQAWHSTRMPARSRPDTPAGASDRDSAWHRPGPGSESG